MPVERPRGFARCSQSLPTGPLESKNVIGTHAEAAAEVHHPRRWLTTVVTNLCLDRLGSARHRRETYVGEWLPEPLVEATWSESAAPDPADRVTFDEEISLALMTVLETLSPAERAEYVLHEAFGMPLHEVADVVGRTPQACRQLAVRARRHIQARAPRFDAEPAALARMIATTLRRVSGLSERRLVNGTPGLVARHDGGTVVLAFAVADGLITEVDIVASPEKVCAV